MPVNYTLKLAILQSPWTGKVIAESIGMKPMRLSKIVGGYTKPTRAEKQRIAERLGLTETALFGVEEKNGLHEASDDGTAAGA